MKLQIEPIEIINSNSNVNEEEEDEIFLQKKSSNDFDLISYIKLDKENEKKEDFLKNKPQKSHKKKKMIFNDPSELFDFVIENNEFKNEFIAEIKEIIEIMGSILYTPPYLILFGRINLAKNKSQKIVRNGIEPKQIDASFYEGFGND